MSIDNTEIFLHLLRSKLEINIFNKNKIQLVTDLKKYFMPMSTPE